MTPGTNVKDAVRPEEPTNGSRSKSIEDYTIEQLKALAYDQIVQLQQTQNNINAIQAEIQKRGKVPGS